MNKPYIFKTIEEAKRERPDARCYFKSIKGIAKGYIVCYYTLSQVQEDSRTGFIGGTALWTSSKKRHT